MFGRHQTTLGLRAGTAEGGRIDRASQERFRRLVENASDVIAIIDEQNLIEMVWGAIEMILKRPVDEVRNLSLLEVVKPEDRDLVRRFLAECRKAPKTRRSAEFRLAGEDERWCEIETFNSRKDDPTLPSLAFRIRDIRERRNAQRALQERSEMLRTLVEASPLAIVVADVEGHVLMWNRAAERIFGWKADETLNRPTPYIVDDSQTDYRHLRQRVLRGETLTALETQRRNKENTVIDVSVSIAPLHDANGRVSGIMEVISNITERKELEAQLRQAQKMEGIGRLAGGIAHDFNNLLTAILGYTDILKQQLAPQAAPSGSPGTDEQWNAIRTEVGEIHRAADRAAALTQGLLAFTRSQVLQPKVLDLNKIVEDMKDMLRRLVGERVDLATFLEARLAPVQADVSQIEQVIMNLVVNANDAMPQGGKLTIETANVELDESYARRRVPVIPGSYVQFSVSDNGCGMDAETQSRIFEPFFTTKERGKGTGLGLSTVYGIVKQSGGYVWVYSEPGHGTTFKVYLPRVPAAVPTEPHAETTQGTGHGTETVLLVEDEEMVRALVRQVLSWNGYSVIEARNGEEALKILEQDRPVDLMLTDVIMPGMSAVDLVKHLETKRPGLKVIYMSGYTDHAIVRNGLLTGNVPFLQKPFAPDRLAHKVREVLGHRG